MPRNLTVTEVTDTSVSLRWSRPDTDGGKPVTRYIVEKRDPAKSTYIPVGTTADSVCEFRVIRLVAGNEYVLRVSAENEVGVGDPAELSQGITAKSPFGKSDFHCAYPYYYPFCCTVRRHGHFCRKIYGSSRSSTCVPSV